MTNEDKAAAIFNAADKLAEEYRREGDNATRDLILESFAELPRESAARLFDILRPPVISGTLD